MEKQLHELKIQPKYFDAVLNGSKTFEIRKNDRGFHVGDNIFLREWDNIKYSGRTIFAEITYLLDDKFRGLEEGYVALSIKVNDYRKIPYKELTEEKKNEHTKEDFGRKRTSSN